MKNVYGICKTCISWWEILVFSLERQYASILKSQGLSYLRVSEGTIVVFFLFTRLEQYQKSKSKPLRDYKNCNRITL